MASLLAWVCDPGHQPDPALWSALRLAAARTRTQACEYVAPGVCAWAAPARAHAAPALIAEAGRLRLMDVAASPVLDWTRPPLTPAALIEIDLHTRAITLLRDPLGQRPLVYARIAHGWLLASSESVLLQHPGVPAALDADWLSAYFACIGLPAERSVYRAIRTVAPGTHVALAATAVRITDFPLLPCTEQRSDGDWLAALRAALERACAQSLADARQPGISLSGGLDSSAVAALCARAGATLQAVCYGSTRYASLDERPWARALTDQIGAQLSTLDADDYAPLSAPRQVSLDTPANSPYRELKSAVYARLQAAGVDVLLTGNFADHLCASPAQSFASAIERRRPAQLLQHYGHWLRRRGPRALWYEPGWRAWLRGLPLPVLPPWLLPGTRSHASSLRQRALDACAPWPRPTQAAHVLGGYAALDAAGELDFSERWGIEVRHPFRDAELTRLALSAPGDLSWRGGLGKWWQRECLQGLLPDAWRLRDKGASMQPLYLHGLQQARARCISLIELGRPLWSRHVTADVQIVSFDNELHSELGGLLIWLLCGLGLWLEAHPRRDEILASTPCPP